MAIKIIHLPKNVNEPEKFNINEVALPTTGRGTVDYFKKLYAWEERVRLFRERHDETADMYTIYLEMKMQGLA